MISRIIGTGAVALGLLAGSSDAALCKLHDLSLSHSTQSSTLGMETTVLSSATIPEISAVPTASPDTTSILGTETSAISSDSPSLSTSSGDTSDPIPTTKISEILSETETSLEGTSTSEVATTEAVPSEVVTSSITPDATTTAQAQSTSEPAVATSYLYNTDFDIPVGPVPSLQQWSLDPGSQTIDSSFYRDGPASLKITNIYGSHITLAIAQTFAQKSILQPDTDYTFSVWVYPTASGTSLSCASVELHCFFGGDPTKLGHLPYTVPLSGANTWQKVSTTCRFTEAQLAEHQVGVEIDFEMGTYANGNSWLDTAFFGPA